MKTRTAVLALAGFGAGSLLVTMGPSGSLTTAANAAAGTEGASSSRTPPAAVVQIAVDEAGTVSVSPDPITVRRGEEVEWRSDVEAFVVLVADGPSGSTRRSPGPGRGPPEDLPLPAQAHERGVHGKSNAPARVRVQESARRGSYKYTVVAWDGTALRVLDPELIID